MGKYYYALPSLPQSFTLCKVEKLQHREMHKENECLSTDLRYTQENVYAA